jgi:hypothetical protein
MINAACAQGGEQASAAARQETAEWTTTNGYKFLFIMNPEEA